MNLEELPWINETKEENTNSYAIPFLSSNPVILEAGTSIGGDTMAFKKQWPDSVIYGFEPHPTNYQDALDNTRNLSGVHLYNMALSNDNEPKVFYMSKKMAGCSSLLEDNLYNIVVPENIVKDFDHKSYEDVPINVQCITINDFCKNNGIKNIDYLWLDTEGSEYYILQEATTILPTVKVISIELNFIEFRKGMSKFEDVYNFLIQNNFILKYIWGRTTWQAQGIFIQK